VYPKKINSRSALYRFEFPHTTCQRRQYSKGFDLVVLHIMIASDLVDPSSFFRTVNVLVNLNKEYHKGSADPEGKGQDIDHNENLVHPEISKRCGLIIF
jgi:hypothetical protein